jgi:endonuclease/exonuclease/phosphatase family metal-dependent hydrolase
VVDYNVHNGVDPAGQVDPEAMARVIEAQDPDVVVLQEVARGWVTNGMMDLGEWMSARLGMPYVFGPAADRQFGNAVLSRLPIVEGRAGLLGRFGGTMERGYVWAVVDVAGTRVHVIGTHLAHRPRDRGARLRQIAALLEAWGGRAPAVIAGDLNAEPGSPELERFIREGLRSAQEVAGEGDLPTFPSTGELIDHILATPDLSLSGFARPFSRASDHLPLAVTVSVAPSG